LRWSCSSFICMRSTLWLDRAHRAPQRPSGIDAAWIKLQHLVVELLRGPRRFREPIEVANVLSRLFDNPRTVVVLGSLVCSDNRARVKRLDFVERRDPLLSLLHVRLRKVEVDVV